VKFQLLQVRGQHLGGEASEVVLAIVDRHLPRVPDPPLRHPGHDREPDEDRRSEPTAWSRRRRDARGMA
jgi:hypothetical protein